MTRIVTSPFPTAYPALRQTWTIAFGTQARRLVAGTILSPSTAAIRRISGRIAFG